MLQSRKLSGLRTRNRCSVDEFFRSCRDSIHCESVYPALKRWCYFEKAHGLGSFCECGAAQYPCDRSAITTMVRKEDSAVHSFRSVPVTAKTNRVTL